MQPDDHKLLLRLEAKLDAARASRVINPHTARLPDESLISLIVLVQELLTPAELALLLALGERLEQRRAEVAG